MVSFLPHLLTSQPGIQSPLSTGCPLEGRAMPSSWSQPFQGPAQPQGFFSGLSCSQSSKDKKDRGGWDSGFLEAEGLSTRGGGTAFQACPNKGSCPSLFLVQA